jgi:membrane protease YdiL (CAAX protease family)
MFIEQIKTEKFKPLLYLPLSLGFLLLIVLNYFSTRDVDTDKIIQDMIEKLGVNTAFVLMVAPLSVACLFVLFWVKFVHRQSIKSLTTSRKKVDWSRIFFSFFLWGTISVATVLIAYYLEPESFIINFKPKPFFTFLILAVILIPLQTSFEEYLFRGYVMQGLGVITRSKLIPFIVTSFVFGMMHIANPEVEKMGYIVLIYYIGTGFFLGVLTLMDDGLELSLGFHAANNLVGALLVTSDWSAFQTHSILKDVSNPSAGYDILLPIFIIYPILLLIFTKKYGWKNWKEKLTGKII